MKLSQWMRKHRAVHAGSYVRPPISGRSAAPRWPSSVHNMWLGDLTGSFQMGLLAMAGILFVTTLIAVSLKLVVKTE